MVRWRISQMKKTVFVITTVFIMLITSRFVIRIVDATVQIDNDIALLILLLIVLNVVIGMLSRYLYRKKFRGKFWKNQAGEWTDIPQLWQMQQTNNFRLEEPVIWQRKNSIKNSVSWPRIRTNGRKFPCWYGRRDTSVLSTYMRDTALQDHDTEVLCPWYTPFIFIANSRRSVYLFV